MKRKLLVLIVVLILAFGVLPSTVGAGGSSPEGPASTKPQRTQAQGEQPPKPEGTSPFQQSLQETFAQRAADGEPVPSSVLYEYEVSEPVQPMSMRSDGQQQQDQTVIITATTTIVFQNPQQAGFGEWPLLDPENKVMETSFDELYYQEIEEAFPGFWDIYEYGQEPRKETYVETYTLNYESQEMLPENSFASDSNSTDNILMGFTYVGPNIDYTFEKKIETCPPQKPIWWPWWIPYPEDCFTWFDVLIGVQLNFSFGLRLPGLVTLSGPEQMVLGSSYNFEATLDPQDWEEGKYSQNSVAPFDGKEYFLKANYFVGMRAIILNQNICTLITAVSGYSCASEAGINIEEDFVMPFGEENNTFPFYEEKLEIANWGLSKLFNDGKKHDDNDQNDDDEKDEAWDEFLDNLMSMHFGLSLSGEIGSDKITAHWNGVQGSNCESEGDITFTTPKEPVKFDVIACNNSTDEVSIRLSDFRYYFTEFTISLGTYLDVTILDYDLALLDLNLITIDLSQLADNLAMSIGKHWQCEMMLKYNEDDWPYIDHECGPAGPSNEITLSVPTVDLVPPTSSVSLNGTAGNNGWYVSDVEVSLSAEDNLPGCSDPVSNIQYRLNGSNWTNYTVPFLIDQEGLNTVDFYAVDDVGNIEIQQTQVVKIDKTPPILSAVLIPPPNSYGWNRTNVTVHFEATDAASGIASVTPDQLLSSEGVNQSVTGTAVDMAGWPASFTVTGINIDKTQPNLTISSPVSGMYANTSSFTVAWSVSDALSGIASETGMIDGQPVQNGQAVNLLLVGAGSHLFSVNAVDKADNQASASVMFSVSIDAEGLLAAVRYLCDLGWINKQGVCNSLEAKLDAAIKSIDKGNLNAAENQLNAFISELEAQKGKSINASAFDVLKAGALFVIEHLPE